jgi:hypothetical protein
VQFEALDIVHVAFLSRTASTPLELAVRDPHRCAAEAQTACDSTPLAVCEERPELCAEISYNDGSIYLVFFCADHGAEVQGVRPMTAEDEHQLWYRWHLWNNALQGRGWVSPPPIRAADHGDNA